MAVRMDRFPPVQLKLTAKLVPTGTVALPSSSLFLGLYFRYQCIYNCPQMFAMRNIIVAFFLVVFDILTITPIAAVLVRGVLARSLRHSQKIPSASEDDDHRGSVTTRFVQCQKVTWYIVEFGRVPLAIQHMDSLFQSNSCSRLRWKYMMRIFDSDSRGGKIYMEGQRTAILVGPQLNTVDLAAA